MADKQLYATDRVGTGCSVVVILALALGCFIAFSSSLQEHDSSTKPIKVTNTNNNAVVFVVATAAVGIILVLMEISTTLGRILHALYRVQSKLDGDQQPPASPAEAVRQQLQKPIPPPPPARR